jgi:N-acetylmuramoyl-L-alanine amidase
MKKLYSYLMIFSFILFSSDLISAINHLNWIEVSDKRFAPQIMLDFSQPLYFENKIDENNLFVEFAFPGMSLKEFKKLQVVEKIKGLKDLIKDVVLSYKDVPCPRVVLKMSFSKKDILVRWNKIDDPNRLIFDIYLKSALKNIKNKSNTLLYAQNDVIKNDIDSIGLPDSLIKLNFPKKKMSKDIRVVVDAGHGGQDPGAKGFFFLKEKDVALDVTRRIKHLLKKMGFNVYLTRNTDKDLSLLERVELANQLKADLFVSVHVNSIQGIENANGIETYHLGENGILPPGRRGGFVFVDNKQDDELSKLADNLLTNNINLSKNLATSIQESIIGFFDTKKLSVANRGIKDAKFRILLKSEIPVSLVEIGFLTNKKEAKRLSHPAYRQMLAEGISRGVKDYIYSLN